MTYTCRGEGRWALIASAIAAFPGGRLDSCWARAAVGAAALSILVYMPFAAILNANSTSTLLNAALVSAALALAMLALLVRYRHLTDEAARQQIRWVLFASAAVVTALAVAFVFGFSKAHNFPWPPGSEFILQSLLSIVFYTAIPLGMLVSMMRFRLYDAGARVRSPMPG